MLSFPSRLTGIQMLHLLLKLQSATVLLSECICPQYKHSRDVVCCFKMFSIIYSHRLLVSLWPEVPRVFLLAVLLPWQCICNTLDPLAPITSSSKGLTQRVKELYWDWIDGLCVLRRCWGQHNYWAFQVAERSGRMGCYHNRPSFLDLN